MIKAIFFDLDGTLMSHASNSIPQSTRDAFVQLRRKGIKLFTATGRHIGDIMKLPLDGMIFDGYVSLNGQLVLDSSQKILYATPVNHDDVKCLTRVFAEKEIPMLIVEEKEKYINFDYERPEPLARLMTANVPRVGEYTGEEVYQFVAFLDDDDERAKSLMAPLKACKMTRWGPHGFDIIPKSGGKSVGVQRMLELFHIKQEEVMAFGDAHNDIDLLDFAAIGVAMGNGTEEAKSHADYVTADIDDDGIMKALKHFEIL